MADLSNLLCDHLRMSLSGARPGPVPAGGDLLWRWFLDLNRSRSYHTAGPNPISYSEILAYGTLMRWPIEPRHVVILLAMDAVMLDLARAKRTPAPEGVKTLPPISSRPMSAGMFDAMFGG